MISNEDTLMFTEKDLKQYFTTHNTLTQPAIDYINNCFYNPPSRMVGTHAKSNVVSWVPSKKLNGQVFSTESRGPEHAFHTLAQYDDKVLWYGDQPEPINIIRTNKNGIQRRGSYTPDAISLNKDGPFVIEIKHAKEVDKLIKKTPSDWKRLESGEVIYKPAQEAFAKMGLKHITLVYHFDDRFYIANLEQILWAREHSDQFEFYREAIDSELSKRFTLSLSELKQTLKLDNFTPLISAIDKGCIVADLKNQLISEPESCLVASNYPLLEHGKEFRKSQLVYHEDLVKPQNLSSIPTYKAAKEALSRLKEVNSGQSNRNIRRWKARIAEGAKTDSSEFQSLISGYHNCGKNTKKLNAKVTSFLNDYLHKVHICRQNISIYRGYKDYQFKAQNAHPEFDPVSRKTFSKHLGNINPEVIGKAKGGKRLGNAMSLPSDPLSRNLKSQAAWQVAAIDHYCVDLFLVIYNKSNTNIVDRPWLTLMIDIFTGKVLAFSISFKKPSRRAVSKVLRACVRNHGRLPREIIVDRGAEFKSVFLASLLAHYSIILNLRPASHSRYGSEVEGFFGEFMKQWLCQREGNLAQKKEARSIDGKLAPRKMAVLSPADFHRELSEFCRWRENKCRGIGSHSSESLFQESSTNFPYISRPINYDAEFIMATSIESEKYTINMQRGINIENIWYSSPAMHLLIGKPKKNEVRIDPENPNLIFVKVIDKWQPFYSSEINTYSSKLAEYQITEGLIKHEAAGLKRKISDSDNLELAKLVHDMDQIRAESNKTPIFELELVKSDTSQKINFPKLNTAKVRPLNIQKWSA